MPPHLNSRVPCQPPPGLLLRLGRLSLLFLPVALLALAGTRVASSDAALLLWLGAAAQAVGCLFALWARQGGRESVGPVLIMLYVIALAWLLFGANRQSDWFLYVAQALLLVVPVGLFGVQCLRDSGATTMRRARQLAAR